MDELGGEFAIVSGGQFQLPFVNKTTAFSNTDARAGGFIFRKAQLFENDPKKVEFA